MFEKLSKKINYLDVLMDLMVKYYKKFKYNMFPIICLFILVGSWTISLFTLFIISLNSNMFVYDANIFVKISFTISALSIIYYLIFIAYKFKKWLEFRASLPVSEEELKELNVYTREDFVLFLYSYSYIIPNHFKMFGSFNFEYDNKAEYYKILENLFLNLPTKFPGIYKIPENFLEYFIKTKEHKLLLSKELFNNELLEKSIKHFNDIYYLYSDTAIDIPYYSLEQAAEYYSTSRAVISAIYNYLIQ